MLQSKIRWFTIGFVFALLCSNASGEVRLELEIEKSTILVNEPVVVQCFVVNDGDEAVEVNPGLSPDGGVVYQIAIEDGDFVTIQGYPSFCDFGPARKERLEPGKKLGARIILAATRRDGHTVPLLQRTGEYRVRAIARMIYLDPNGDYEEHRSAMAESNVVAISVILPREMNASDMERRMSNPRVLRCVQFYWNLNIETERLMFEIAVLESEYSPFAAMALAQNEIYKCDGTGMHMEAWLRWRDDRLQRAQSWALIADQQGSPLQTASIEMQIRIARMLKDDDSVQQLQDRLLDDFPESSEAIRIIRQERIE